MFLKRMLHAGLTLAATLSCLSLQPALATPDAPPTGTTYVVDSVMTYEIFEVSVPHADLAECPAEFDPDVVFCRVTLAFEQLNIFVFAYEDGSPLLAIKHLSFDEDAILD